MRHGPRDWATAARLATQLLSGDDPPTALFTSNDLITLGTIDALADRTASVALVGFDEFALADKLTPPVTVVAQDPVALGAMAAQLLFARIAGDASPRRHIILETRLVIRASGEILPGERYRPSRN